MTTATTTDRWFAGLTCDHLYANCPARTSAEATLREVGWWDLQVRPGDPLGSDVCGLCQNRYRRHEEAP